MLKIESLKAQFDAIFAARGQPTRLTRTSLASGQLVETAYTNVNNRAEVWRAYWPYGTVAKIDTGRSYRLLLAHVQTVAAQGGAGNEVFTVTHFPARVLDPAEGYEDGTYQGVWLKSDGTKCAIVSVADEVDGGTPSITAAVSGNYDHQLGYVPYFDGEIDVNVESPRGGGSLTAEIARHNLVGLHTENQALENFLTFTGYIAPDYSLSIFARSAYTLAWSSGATAGAVSLPFAIVDLPLLVCPVHNFFVKGESYPGQALRMVADWCLARR